MRGISKQQLIDDFRNLGIEQGDFLFITGDLLRVGYFQRQRNDLYNDWMEILKEVVGSDGDIIVAAYSNTFFSFKKNKDLIFTKDSPTICGSLSDLFLKSEGTFRSSHPTNSYVGFGKRASKVLNKHDANSTSYQVVEDILEYKAKNLLMGTIDKSNAPMAFHQVLFKLGYNNKHPFSGLGQVYYFNENGEKKLFTRYDVGGCSGGSYKLLPELLNLESTRYGNIGNSKTLVLDGKDSFDAINNVLRKNISSCKCNDVSCVSCYGRLYSLTMLPSWLLNLNKIIKRLR